jgi:glycerophosphoryl diester phosphodiesterase
MKRREKPLAFFGSMMKSCRSSNSNRTTTKSKYVFTNKQAWMIAHRGASYHLPEHTIAAHRLAYELGADYLELDLVVSSDGILFVLHSVDLTETTNVVDQYPSSSSQEQRRSWYSPTQQRTSYWSFNFTAAELSQLSVRQRLAEQRSTLYDYLFTVPTLQEVAESLVVWNNDNSKNSSNNNVLRGPERGPAGLYVELKDSDWIHQETGQDVVELLYREMVGVTGSNDNNTTDDDDDSTKNPWPTILAQGHYCNRRNINTVVPGLIVQSFNGMDLQRFHDLWWSTNTTTTTITTTAGDTTTTTTTSNNSAAMPPTPPMPPPPYEPPYVLLVDYPTCTEDQFWSQVEQQLSLISAIGCELSCLDHSTVIEYLLDYQLPSHVWTVRPEDLVIQNAANTTTTTVADATSVVAQMNSLVGNTRGVVRGIFTETPALRPFYYTTPPTGRFNNIPPNEWNNNNNSNNNAALSSFLGTMIASFLLGAATAVAVLLLHYTMGGGRRQRYQQQHHDAVPTAEEEIPPSLT